MDRVPWSAHPRATPALRQPPTRRRPASSAAFWSRPARSLRARWRRRSCTARGCWRSGGTSTMRSGSRGNSASWEPATKAAAESGGEILAVTDRDILAAYRLVARGGLFAELASAASVAGLLQLSGMGRLERRSTVVCVLTGHGLKEPEWAVAGA